MNVSSYQVQMLCNAIPLQNQLKRRKNKTDCLNYKWMLANGSANLPKSAAADSFVTGDVWNPAAALPHCTHCFH